MRRGDIYVAALHPRSGLDGLPMVRQPGSELHGERPVIVLSHDAFNQVEGWRSVTVVPLTTSIAQARRGPTAVRIPDGAGGLRGDGVAVCHQITTLDRAKLTRRIGALPPESLRAVEVGVRAALDLV